MTKSNIEITVHDIIVRSGDAAWTVQVSMSNSGTEVLSTAVGGFSLDGIGNTFDHGERWERRQAPAPVVAGATTMESFDLKAKLGDRVPGPGDYTLTVMVLVGDRYTPSSPARVTVQKE